MEHIGNIGDTYWKISGSFDAGHKYTVPYFWGTVGILYNTAMMDKALTAGMIYGINVIRIILLCRTV